MRASAPSASISGRRRIGVAVSDRSGTIASPLTVLQRSGSVKRDHQAHRRAGGRGGGRARGGRAAAEHERLQRPCRARLPSPRRRPWLPLSACPWRPSTSDARRSLPIGDDGVQHARPGAPQDHRQGRRRGDAAELARCRHPTNRLMSTPDRRSTDSATVAARSLGRSRHHRRPGRSNAHAQSRSLVQVRSSTSRAMLVIAGLIVGGGVGLWYIRQVNP